MGIADRLNELRTKALEATVEHSDKIHEAVEKVASTADERTGGKYHEHIQKAGAKAGSLVDGLTGAQPQKPAQDPPPAPGTGEQPPAAAAEGGRGAPAQAAEGGPSAD